MGAIVAGFGVPHTPSFPSVAARQGTEGEIERLYGEVRRRLEAAAPDTLIIISSDHFNTFFMDRWPTFAIGAAPTTAGPNEEVPGLERRVFRIDESLALSIHRTLVEAGFGPTLCLELELDHSFIVPLYFLLREFQPAIVPIHINSMVAPLPTAQRCRELGAALRSAVERCANGARAAVLAAGSFSLEVGGPRIRDDAPFGVPDPGWVDDVGELLVAGDVDGLVRRATAEQLAQAGNAGGEVLDWIAMVGALAPAKPSFYEVQPEFGHAFAAWPEEAP